MKTVLADVPFCDFDMTVKGVSRFPEVGGVYVFLTHDDKELYIGKTKCFKKRMTSHKFKGCFTRDFIHLVTKVRLYEMDDATDRAIYEIYFINKLQPIFNKEWVNNYKSQSEKLNYNCLKNKLSLEEILSS